MSSTGSVSDLLLEQIRRRASDPKTRTDMSKFGGGFSLSPIDEGTIASVESMLGLRLPVILKALYRDVGNGGFGPGYGLLPLHLHDDSTEQETATELYSLFCKTDPEDRAWVWPRNLLPFCDWGCAIRSCIDCGTTDGAILTFDPNARAPDEAMSVAFARSHASLGAWIRDWIAGVQIWDLMFEPDPSRTRSVTNPFTAASVPVTVSRLRRAPETVTLYRPVGPKELALIEASGWREFPPRLPDQPIFYPVTNLAYAAQIARDWNVKASGAGYVTKFEVQAEFLGRYEIQKVGGSDHTEYWIPAEDLAAFNAQITSPIAVVAEFR